MRTGSCIVKEGDVRDPGRDFGSVRPRRRSSSSSLLPFSPLLMIDGLTRKSLSYDKLPPEPIKLSILKLDGSSFDVRVMGAATVGELKEAVESAFSHMPKKGPGKISWRHVWGHFCLCYNDLKLLLETDPIINYGIKDGDQLHIIRHVSSIHVMDKKRPSKKLSSSKQRRRTLSRSILDEGLRMNNGGNEDADGDLESGSLEYYKKPEDFTGRGEIGFTQFLKGWYSLYSPLPTGESRRRKDKARPSRCIRAFWHRFGKIVMSRS